MLTEVDSVDAAEAAGWSEVLVTGDLAGGMADGVQVSGSRFVDTACTAARFDGARFTDVRFERCDLSGAELNDVALTRVEFVDCKLSGTLFGAARLRDVRFTECRMDGAHLRSVRGERLWIERCTATNLDLAASEVTGARLVDCDLGRLDVSQARLPGVRLHGSLLDGLLGASSLRDAHIDATQIVPLALRMFEAVGIVVDDPDGLGAGESPGER